MAKRRKVTYTTDDGKETFLKPKKAAKTVTDKLDLDNGFETPIKSYRDINGRTIQDTLTHSRYAQLVVGLTVIGIFLRFYNLTFNSIWLDEASTYIFSRGSFSEIWGYMLAGDYNPPLFQFLVHFALMFGANEFTIRVVPAIAGVLVIPVMYYVGKEFFDRNVGVIAAAATTVSPFLILYSQEGRAYTLTLLAVAIEFLFYLKATKSGSTKDWLLFGFFAAFAFWTHFYTAVFTALLFLYTFLTSLKGYKDDWRSIKTLVAAAGVFVIVTLPLLIEIVPLYMRRTAAGAPTYGIQGYPLILETLSELSGFQVTLLGIFLLLFAIGVFQLYLTDKVKAGLLVWLLAATSAISIFMSYRIPMLPRYLIFFSIIFFVGIAVSYKVFYAVAESRAIIYACMILFFVTSMTFLPSYYTSVSKDDWRGFSTKLTQITKPGDILILSPGYNSQPLDFYYSNATDGTIELNNLTTTVQDYSSVSAPEGNTIYFIVTGDINAADPGGSVVAWLQQQTTPSAQNGGIFMLAKKKGV